MPTAPDHGDFQNAHRRRYDAASNCTYITMFWCYPADCTLQVSRSKNMSWRTGAVQKIGITTCSQTIEQWLSSFVQSQWLLAICCWLNSSLRILLRCVHNYGTWSRHLWSTRGRRLLGSVLLHLFPVLSWCTKCNVGIRKAGLCELNK